MITIITNTVPAVLKQLFDRQMAKAVELSGNEAEIKALFPFLKQIGKTEEGEGRSPFVIVAQRSSLTLAMRLAKVELDGKAGASYLFDSRMINLDYIPPGHYLMVDVEDGRARLNTKPSVCLARFKQDGRWGGTAVEGITVAAYESEILRHHYIDLPGSSYDGGKRPCLFLNGGKPWFSAVCGDYASPIYGSLSCGRRLWLAA